MVPVEEKKPESVQIVVIPSPVDNTSSTFLGAKAQSIKELEKDCQTGNPNACAKLRYIYVEVGDTQKNRHQKS